jgi:hypothetical protein
VAGHQGQHTARFKSVDRLGEKEIVSSSCT